MSRLAIKKVPTTEDRTLPIFDEMEEIAHKIREHAYELFASRGFMAGRDLDDWLDAERDICSSASEFIEKEDKFVLKIALAGFEPDDIEITANPRELIIKAAREVEREDLDEGSDTNVRWSDLLSNDVYRRIEFPIDVEIDEISAKFKRGLLTIEAPKVIKATEPPKKVKIITTA